MNLRSHSIGRQINWWIFLYFTVIQASVGDMFHDPPHPPPPPPPVDSLSEYRDRCPQWVSQLQSYPLKKASHNHLASTNWMTNRTDSFHYLSLSLMCLNSRALVNGRTALRTPTPILVQWLPFIMHSPPHGLRSLFVYEYGPIDFHSCTESCVSTQMSFLR